MILFQLTVVASGLVLMSAAGIAEQLPAHAISSAWRTTVVRAPLATAPRTANSREEGLVHAASLAPHALEGIASYYWQGQKTASGENFERDAFTAAHPTLPFNSLVRVRDRASGGSVVVRINDRGPFKPGRVIDLSEGAAEVIGLTSRGLAPVDIEILSIPGR